MEEIDGIIFDEFDQDSAYVVKVGSLSVLRTDHLITARRVQKESGGVLYEHHILKGFTPMGEDDE